MTLFLKGKKSLSCCPQSQSCYLFPVCASHREIEKGGGGEEREESGATKREKEGAGRRLNKDECLPPHRDEKRVLVPGCSGKGDECSAWLMSIRSA